MAIAAGWRRCVRFTSRFLDLGNPGRGSVRE